MIDLSTLTIPPVSVVPEPTDELAASVLSLAATAAQKQGPCGVDHNRPVLFSLARRCRELECTLAITEFRYRERGAQIKVLETAIAELEAKVERLKQVGRDFTPGLAESTYDG